jgi:pimeloyl-ACP methyl ester carboxylesterase
MRACNAPERAVKAAELLKLWRILLAMTGATLLFVGAHWIRVAELPKQEIVLSAGGCHTPVTVLQPPPGVQSAGSVVLIHGLSANRRLMMYLAEDFAGHGFQSYAIDLPGHGDSKDTFSFSRAQDCATAAVEALIKAHALDPKTTVLVGHSMGGSIAIRMADRDPVSATIAISPGPTIAPQRMPSNLLVFSASADIGILKQAAQSLLDLAGGRRNAPADFAQRRAFELQLIPHSSHTSLISDRRVAHNSEQWAMQSLFSDISPETIALNLDLATYETFGGGRRRLAGGALGFAGILLIFPLAISLFAKIGGATSPEVPGLRPRIPMLLAEVAICAMIGVLILTVGVPLKFLHVYTGAYLVSLLGMIGAMLLVLNFGFALEYASLRPVRLVAAAIFAFATFLAIGAWLNWQLTDAWLNAPRWRRFAEILPFLWLYFFAEEVVLGPVRSKGERAKRFAVFLALRLEIFLACLLAYYAFASGQVLIVLLFVYLALFSILQRLATDALRSRTGAATAAALFGAILGAWFIASLFPLT